MISTSFFSSHVWFILQADGRVYTWGRGFPGFSDAHSPVELPSSLQIKQIALGWNHALVLTGTSSHLCIELQPIYSWYISTPIIEKLMFVFIKQMVVKLLFSEATAMVFWAI